MAGRISPDDVAHVARLARLELSDTEVATFASQLSDVLDHAADVEALDTTGVEPMVHPLPLRNVLRPDEVGAVLERSEVLAAAPDTADGQFRVPAILGDPE